METGSDIKAGLEFRVSICEHLSLTGERCVFERTKWSSWMRNGIERVYFTTVEAPRERNGRAKEGGKEGRGGRREKSNLL